MRNILKIASLLDYSGQYNLSDKLFKIAQGTYNPNNFPQQSLLGSQPNLNNSGFYDPNKFQTQPIFNSEPNQFIVEPTRRLGFNSDDPRSFEMNIIDFSRDNNINNFIELMDKYADAGATYKNKSIKEIPAFQQLYINLKDGKRFSIEDELTNLLDEFAKNPSLKPQDFLTRARNDPNAKIKSDAQVQADKLQDQRYFLLNTTEPAAFANALMQFGKMNNINNLTQAFDAYANAGASYQNNLIKNVPALKELYMRVRNTPRQIDQNELAKELEMISTPQRTTSNVPRIDFYNATPDQIFEYISLLINNSRDKQQLDAAKTYIFSNGRKLNETQLGSLNGLADEKAAEIAENNEVEKENSRAMGTSYYETVKREPLSGLETLRLEIEQDQNLNQNQKTNLINIIDERIRTRK